MRHLLLNPVPFSMDAGAQIIFGTIAGSSTGAFKKRPSNFVV
jgi:hypothetical protein